MKTFLSAILVLITTSAAMSQSGMLNFSGTYSDKEVPDELKKGNTMFGLNGLGNYRNTMLARNGTWSLTGQAGYMIVNRLVVGAQASMASDFVKSKSSPPIGESRYYSFAPEFFGRYYFTSYRVKPFVQLSAGYNFQWGQEQEGGGRKLNVSAQNPVAAGALGISFLLSKKILLEAMYNHRFLGQSTYEDPSKSLKVRLGVSVYLR